MDGKIKDLEKKIQDQYALLKVSVNDAEWWEINSKINNLSVDLATARDRRDNRGKRSYMQTYAIPNNIV